MLRVCHVSPTYFAAESVLGGGERFAEELARAEATEADVRFVGFGARARRERLAARYERVILKSWTSDPMTPFSPRLFSELRGADVIHCHQYNVLPTFLAAAFGHWQGSRVFVSDLGGGGFTPGYQIDQSRWLSGHLPISEYAARGLPGRPRPHRVIYGGVDPERYAMRSALEHDASIVVLGRILPHKGVHLVVEALPERATLHVIGTAPDAAYLERLKVLAAGRDVRFHLGLSDPEIVAHLQRAMALVHATPVDEAGSAGASELFGLALVEAMACGCPVVAARAASLPEIVVDGETGVLVPANDVAAIRRALLELPSDQARWVRSSRASRERVEALFTWSAVARRALAAYETLGTPPASRRARWISSETGDPAALARLHAALNSYYGDARSRAPYQAMLDLQDGEQPEAASVRRRLPDHLLALQPASSLEIGCGNGRLLRQLRELGFRGAYTGVDLAPDVLAANRRRHAEDRWAAASAYALPFPDGCFELVFALYVLEHLVYPRRGLEEMLRVVRPGGHVVLVFPAFTEGGQLTSQQVGLSVGGTASDKLRAGRPLDALVSLYDSRLRLPRLLRGARRRVGAFPVNLSPVCLSGEWPVAPDLDAVYLASRDEVRDWAERRGCAVSFPAGISGEFAFQCFMSLRRPASSVP